MVSQTDARTEADTCATCQSALSGRAAFFIRDKRRRLLKCARCSLISRDMLKRSALVALIVGTALVALNQGDKLAAGTFAWGTDWYKVPLTYMVPFCVATYGALANGYQPPQET